MCQLEYPVGKVLFRERLIDDLRFSPNGKYLAFITHSEPSDDRGTVVILRASGEKVAASPLYESSQGLAWSASGDEVWSTSPLESGVIHALSLSGKTREPLAVPGRLFLRDITADGQILVAQGVARRGIVVSSNQGASLRDLSWLDFSYLRDITTDGKMILFEEEGSDSAVYSVYVRDTDGSPAVPIGEGYGLALSRDKRWALAEKLTDPVHEIWLLPVGTGEPRRISPPTLTPHIAAGFLSDGKHIVYVANEVGRRLRTWMQDLDGGAPRAISEEGVAGFLVSPDDRWMIVGRKATVTGIEQAQLLSIAEGKTVEIRGLKPDDRLLGWTSDSQLYVASGADKDRTGVHIEKLNPRPAPARRGATSPPPPSEA
jgi:Tol biopolymer transport system component